MTVTSAEAAVIRGGATRLARRLRSERPGEALPSNQVSLLSHLVRHGASTLADLAIMEHHQHPALLRAGLEDLRAAGLVVDSGDAVAITDSGHAALEQDLASRDGWLAGVLGDLDAEQVTLLLQAAELMGGLADLPGTHRFLPERGASPSD